MEQNKIMFELSPLQNVPVYGDFYLPTVLVRCKRAGAVLSSHLIPCVLGDNLTVKFTMSRDAMVYVRKVEFNKQIEMPF